MKSIKKLIVMCAAGCLALLTVACGGGDAGAELQTLRMFRTIQTQRMFVPFRWGCPTRPSGCSHRRLLPTQRMFDSAPPTPADVPCRAAGLGLPSRPIGYKDMLFATAWF